MITATAVLSVMLYFVVFGLIFWIVSWGVNQIAIPEPFNKIVQVLLIVFAVVIVINGLLMLIGSPFITFIR